MDTEEKMNPKSIRAVRAPCTFGSAFRKALNASNRGAFVAKVHSIKFLVPFAFNGNLSNPPIKFIFPAFSSPLVGIYSEITSLPSLSPSVN